MTPFRTVHSHRVDDIGTAIAGCERTLRELMVSVFRSQFGQGWVKQAVYDKDLRTAWQAMLEAEERNSPGHGNAPSLLTVLDFSTLGQLLDVANRHWTLLQPALGPRDLTMPLLRRLTQIRNGNSHSREPLPYEQHLALGISGEIRNRVATFMSTQSPSGEYYPRVEMVRDNYGNQVDVATMREIGTIAAWTNLKLTPGTEVTFDCRGVDPQGRDLSWYIYTGFTPSEIKVGNEVQLTWVVGRGDVQAVKNLNIRMKSAGEFHRKGGHDVEIDFFYEVVPY